MKNLLIVLPVLSLLGLFAFTLLGMGVAFAIFDVELESFGNPDNYRSLQALKLVQAMATIGTFLAPAVIFARLVKKDPVRWYQLDLALPQGLMLSALLALAALPFIALLATWNMNLQLPEALGWLEEWMRSSEDEKLRLVEAFLKVTTPGELLVNLLVVAVLPAVGEELLFRGAIQQSLMSRISPHWAIWITAFLFSAIHFQFYGFLPRFLLGGIFGYLAWYGGSLWYPILAHFVNNAVTVVVMFYIYKGEVDSSYENFGGNPGDLLYGLASGLSLVLFLYLFKMLIPRRD